MIFIPGGNGIPLQQQQVISRRMLRRPRSEGRHDIGIRIHDGEQVIPLPDLRNVYQIGRIGKLCPCKGIQRIHIQLDDALFPVVRKFPEMLEALVIRAAVRALRHDQGEGIDVQLLCRFCQMSHSDHSFCLKCP